MFARFRFFALLFLSLFTLAWGCWVFPFHKEDVAVFQKFLREKELGKSSSVLSTTKQERKAVVKDLWISEEQGRVHHRILGSSSTLLLIPKGSHFDVIEKLEGITCWMQDKIYPATHLQNQEQQVRILRAKEGFYTYSNQQFLAQSVNLSLYRLPGDRLPEQIPSSSPFLKGIARDISFTLAGKTPQFKANQFQAEISQGKNL